MLINFSNHPYLKWSDKQKQAAIRLFGEVEDMPFPNIPADDGIESVLTLADEYVSKIIAKSPSGVLCQGEFTLTFAVISALIEHHIPVYAACSERNVTKRISEDGKEIKETIFEFSRFREYAFLSSNT